MIFLLAFAILLNAVAVIRLQRRVTRQNELMVGSNIRALTEAVEQLRDAVGGGRPKGPWGPHQ